MADEIDINSFNFVSEINVHINKYIFVAWLIYLIKITDGILVKYYQDLQTEQKYSKFLLKGSALVNLALSNIHATMTLLVLFKVAYYTVLFMRELFLKKFESQTKILLA